MKISSLDLDENQNVKSEEKLGFWKRQFQKESTLAQSIFDLVFGLFLPIFCFFYDPIVFKGGGMNGALLSGFKPFAYLLCYVSLTSLVLWLTCGEKLKKFNVILAGVLFTSGLVSLVVGLILLPFSLIGLLLLIGALGFTPLFTAFVYLRNGVRAFNESSQYFERVFLTRSIAVIALTVLAIPALFNLKLNRAIDNMIAHADSRNVYDATFRVSPIWYLVDTNRIVDGYIAQNSEEKKKVLEMAYQLIDGGDIKLAARRFND